MSDTELSFELSVLSQQIRVLRQNMVEIANLPASESIDYIKQLSLNALTKADYIGWMLREGVDCHVVDSHAVEYSPA